MTTSVIADEATLSSEHPEVACSLTPAEQVRRGAELLRSGLFSRIVETVPLSDGYRIVFAGADADLERDVDDFVAFEQKCCSFATFTTGRAGDHLWLEIRGAEGTREFVEGWLPQTGAAKPAATGSGGRNGLLTMVAAVGLCCVAPVLAAVGLTTLATVANPWAEALAMATFGAGGAMWWMGRRAKKAAGAPQVQGGDCGC